MQRVSRLCLSSGVGFQKVSTVPVFLSLMKISLSCGGGAEEGTEGQKALLTRPDRPSAGGRGTLGSKTIHVRWILKNTSTNLQPNTLEQKLSSEPEFCASNKI